MRISVVLYILLNLPFLLMGQEKVGFYSKNNFIEFNTVDSLVC